MNNVMERQINTSTEHSSRQYGNRYYNDMRYCGEQQYYYNNGAYNANAYSQSYYAAPQYAQQPAYATSAQQYYQTSPQMMQQPYYDMGQSYRINYDSRYSETPEDNTRASEYNMAESFGVGDNLSKEKKNKKSLNFKAKMLIVLYFVIIAVVATLVFVNIGLRAGSTSAEGEVSQYTESATAYMQAPDGSLMALDAVESADYTYDTTTNWFDDFCDWIGRQVG